MQFLISANTASIRNFFQLVPHIILLFIQKYLTYHIYRHILIRIIYEGTTSITNSDNGLIYSYISYFPLEAYMH